MKPLTRAAYGLIQAPRYRYVEDLKAGTLVELLSEHPPSPLPVSVLYLANRPLATRVRIFIDWLIEIVVPRL